MIAVAKGAVAADFRQPLRLRVRDHTKDVVIELRTSGRRPRPLARFIIRMAELLTAEDWTFPLTERPFTEVLDNRMANTMPKFLARIQFLAAGKADGRVQRESHAKQEWIGWI